MENIKGDAYKISAERALGRGCILEPWEKNITFEEFNKKQIVCCWLTPSYDSIGYYFFIEADILQEGSMTAPETFGVFIPKGVDKKAVADALRKFWGPGTKLLKK